MLTVSPRVEAYATTAVPDHRQCIIRSSGEWLRLEHIEKGTRCQNFYALIFAKIEEELIAADQKVRFPFDGTFQVAIIRRIVCNDRQGEPPWRAYGVMSQLTDKGPHLRF